MAARSVSGASSQSCSSRAPIGVTVRSRTASSEPSRLPSRSVRVSSRLRRVTSSSEQVAAPGGTAAAGAGGPGSALSVSCRYSSRAPAAARHGWSSSKPKPASVLTPKCWSRAARAVAGSKVQSGRGVSVAAGAGRASARRAGRRRPRRTRHSGGASRASSSASRSAGHVGGLELPGGQVDPGQADVGSAAGDDGGQVVGRRGSSRSSSVRVPGVTTRVTSRRTRPLASGGVLDLVADGDAVAGLQQLAQVAFELVVREAGHRDRSCRGW